jgi:hypothetical protein
VETTCGTQRDAKRRFGANAQVVHGRWIGLSVGALVLSLAAAQGGFFASAWPLATAACAALAGVVLIRGAPGLCRIELAWLGALILLACWTAASSAWSVDPGATVLETERACMYALGAGTLVLLARTGGPAQVLSGVLAGSLAACSYGLWHHLMSRGTPGAVLESNVMGILAAVGLAVAFGLGAALPSPCSRALLSGAAVPLAAALFFTSSRGAWLALAIACAALVLVGPDRLRLLVRAAPAAAAAAAGVWLCTASGAADGDAGAARRLLVLLPLVAVACACLGAGAAHVSGRIRPSHGVQRTAARLVAVALVALAVAGVVRAGGPQALVERGAAAASERPVWSTRDANARLLSLWAGLRPQLWAVAWDTYRAHPWSGTGAGTYYRSWFDRPDRPFAVRDAHSLYLEALAELGPVGLAAVLASIGLPLAGLRARRDPLVGAALATYLAVAVHLGIDWDWELPVVTITGLALGAACITSTRAGPGYAATRAPARVAAGGLCVAVVLVEVVREVLRGLGS